MLGLVTPAFSIGTIDSTTHMAEGIPVTSRPSSYVRSMARVVFLVRQRSLLMNKVLTRLQGFLLPGSSILLCWVPRCYPASKPHIPCRQYLPRSFLQHSKCGNMRRDHIRSQFALLHWRSNSGGSLRLEFRP